MNRVYSILSFVLMIAFSPVLLNAQISPGDLSNAHSNLEGLSNCTQCHVLGNKVSSDKCLVCHTEIKTRIDSKKGYHASSDVAGGECALCHSEHNGKNFRLINLDTENFDHDLTGYHLSVPHAKKACTDCHSSKYITEPKLKAKKKTYLGLGQECLNCHADYHLRTLSSDCEKCHNSEKFAPASKFSHDNAKFKLAGKHTTVDCAKCHKIKVTDGVKFQQFTGIQYSNCTSCHKDPHNNQFGQNCRKCHSEESFHKVDVLTDFDHNKTGYKLEDKHLIVNCKSCHKNKLTDPLKHDFCKDCHADYHNGQFVKNGIAPDCSQCHSLKGFTSFSYTVEQHNLGKFQLRGAHEAIPCYECHKKQEKWSFRNIGVNCKDCHQDIHKTYIRPEFYPESECRKCHNEISWSSISFDHSKTGFQLTGMHVKTRMPELPFQAKFWQYSTKFSGLPQQCSECHADKHFRQFEKGGVTTCTDCHDTNNWKASKFDHNTTSFKLDGKHVNVPCYKCHKPQKDGDVIYTKYKIKDFRCESCHS
ncbi:MAG: cytochrome C [Bacteroidetes bacterium]|nr:cytochrome C [Bacteroidota bacterium]